MLLDNCVRHTIPVPGIVRVIGGALALYTRKRLVAMGLVGLLLGLRTILTPDGSGGSVDDLVDCVHCNRRGGFIGEEL